MNYLILLCGFKDLAAKGAINQLAKLSESPNQLDLSAIIKGISNQIPSVLASRELLDVKLNELTRVIDVILGPLELKCESQENHIQFELDELAYELSHNVLYLSNFLMESAGSLLILAHEISKYKPWHDKGPYWEFLRHCRNAAAHGGLFILRNREPSCLAKWGPFCIERSLQGTQLFKDQNGIGLLSPGDPIRLLWDIEQAYPDMVAQEIRKIA